MLAAWLIVDAVMAVLYHPNDSTWGTWSSLVTGRADDNCLQQAGALPSDTLNQAELNDVVVVPNTNNTVPDYLLENMIRQEFADAGVGINKNACTAAEMASNGSLCGGTPPSCTNVNGMQKATIDQVIAIAKAVGSTKENQYVVITGGTEPGHACGNKSHQLGFKVDLRPTDAVNNYLKNPTMYAGERSGGEPGPIYLDKCRLNTYVFALTHWDITVNSTCIPLK
jgi:hypothetical protein